MVAGVFIMGYMILVLTVIFIIWKGGILHLLTRVEMLRMVMIFFGIILRLLGSLMAMPCLMALIRGSPMWFPRILRMMVAVILLMLMGLIHKNNLPEIIED